MVGCFRIHPDCNHVRFIVGGGRPSSWRYSGLACMVCGMNRRLRKACVGVEALAGVASSRQGSKHLPRASPSGLVDMLARFGDFARHRLAPKYWGLIRSTLPIAARQYPPIGGHGSTRLRYCFRHSLRIWRCSILVGMVGVRISMPPDRSDYYYYYWLAPIVLGSKSVRVPMV